MRERVDALASRRRGELRHRDELALEVPMEDRPYGLISDWLPATGVAFRVNHPDQNIDFHVAPKSVDL